MKRHIKSVEHIFGMANIHPKRTGLPVTIWADNGGVSRNKPNSRPRVKIGTNEYSVSVSIDNTVEVLALKDWESNFKVSEIRNIQKGIKYVEENSDLFLKHYLDTDGSFDDEDLFDALRERGRYK